MKRILTYKHTITKSEKSKAITNGIVYPVNCIVEKVTGSNLPNFEPINAYSLNDAYMKTYDFYFALFGKPTINIYNNFSIIIGNTTELLFKHRMFLSSIQL